MAGRLPRPRPARPPSAPDTTQWRHTFATRLINRDVPQEVIRTLLDQAGAHITFGTVAREARVSRSWLYTQPELRPQIERLRTLHPNPAAARPAPDRQRASDTSLLRRLEAATARIRHLETENKELCQALEHALGQRRAAEITSQCARSG